MIRITLFVVIAYATVSSASAAGEQQDAMKSPVLAKQITVDKLTTHPISFLREVALSSVASKLRDSETDKRLPFFIVYEGTQNELKLAPGTIHRLVPNDSGRKFVSRISNGSVLEAIAYPLEAGDSDLRAFVQDNTLVVQENSMISLPDWPMNVVVSESKTKALTYLEAQQLLREKYRWNDGQAEPAPLPLFCDTCSHEIVMPQTNEDIAVRDLLLAVLRKATVKAYSKSESRNWVGAFQIMEGIRTPDEPRTWQLVLFAAKK